MISRFIYVTSFLRVFSARCRTMYLLDAVAVKTLQLEEKTEELEIAINEIKQSQLENYFMISGFPFPQTDNTDVQAVLQKILGKFGWSFLHQKKEGGGHRSLQEVEKGWENYFHRGHNWGNWHNSENISGVHVNTFDSVHQRSSG